MRLPPIHYYSVSCLLFPCDLPTELNAARLQQKTWNPFRVEAAAPSISTAPTLP